MFIRFFAAGLLVLVSGCAYIKSGEIVNDNDFHAYGSNADHNYTNGMAIRLGFHDEESDEFGEESAGRAASGEEDAPLRRGTPEWVQTVLLVPELMPGVRAEQDVVRTNAVSVGHQMYTPTNLSNENIDPDDRPYAGYMYASFLSSEGYYDPVEESHDYSIGREISLGMVGPSTYADDLQIWYHDRIGAEDPKGWKHQLHDEPILQLSLWRKDRGLCMERGSIPVLSWMGCDLDTVSIVGGELGNARTHLFGSNNLRVGWGLPRDLGLYVDRIGSGNTLINESDDEKCWSLYLMSGVQGRAVARDIFLDGNTFRDSHHVTKENLVAEMYVGCVGRVRLGGEFWINLSYVYTHRTPEFREHEEAHTYGSWRLWIDF